MLPGLFLCAYRWKGAQDNRKGIDMDTNKFSIKPDSVLHRLLKLIAEEVAKEFSTVSAEADNAKNSKEEQTRKFKSKKV